MKTVLLLSMIILSAGCASNVEHCTFCANIKEYQTAVGPIWELPAKNGPATKRIFLIHGLTKDHTMFYFDAPGYLSRHLNETGWDIVWLDLPYTMEGNPYPDLVAMLNSSYRDYWQGRLQAVLDFSDQQFGTRSSVVIGGISWGGLHTLMGAALMPQFKAYVAYIPVVDTQALLVGFPGHTVSNFSPFAELPQLQAKPGYMAWAGQDHAVDPTWSQNFVTQMGGGLFQSIEYATYVHEETNQMMDDSFAFIDAQ